MGFPVPDAMRMAALPSDAPLMIQTLNVLDQLEQARQAQAAPVTREALLESVTQLCHSQGESFSPEAIANAVDQQQRAPPTPTASVNFGWDRPTDRGDLQARKAALDSPAAMSRRKTHQFMANTDADDHVIMTGFFLGVEVGVLATLHAWLGLPWWLLVGAGVILNTWLTWRLVQRVTRGARDQTAREQLTAWEMKQGPKREALEALWLRYPLTRHYLQACFRSALPQLFWGDKIRLDALLEEAKEVARQEEQLAALNQLAQAALTEDRLTAAP